MLKQNLGQPGRSTSRKVMMGERQIITHGLRRQFWQDIYHYSMTASWPTFYLGIAIIFILLNLFFTGLYLLGDKPIANLAPSGFWGAFFFSVETIATVGYGDMHPQTWYAHLISTIEIFVGMTNIALITGVMFARFSKPRAMIMFAENPVTGKFDGRHTLTIRVANARQNVIVEASARLRLIRNEVSAEGIAIRRLYDLKLIREQQPIFLLGWNLMHVIDEASPLYAQTQDTLVASDAGLILTIEGVDETTNHFLQARHVYGHRHIRWQHRYVDILSTDADGISHMDYHKFHAVLPID